MASPQLSASHALSRSWLQRIAGISCPATVQTADSASEWLRLSERYRQMSDDELLILARRASALTDAARQALASEISVRGLRQPPEQPRAAPDPQPAPDSPYAEDRELVEICVVWSLADALQLQTLLDRAGIPFFMGAGKATCVDSVTSNFAEGVSVQVMRVGLPWAWQPMLDYEPANEPPQAQEEAGRAIPVRCPKCHSTEVIFERLILEPQTRREESTSKYEWTCDLCGHHWQDEGLVREA